MPLASIFIAASLLAGGLLAFLVKRPRVLAPEDKARPTKARAAAAGLAARAGATPDPSAGGAQASAFHSGRWKTY